VRAAASGAPIVTAGNSKCINHQRPQHKSRRAQSQQRSKGREIVDQISLIGSCGDSQRDCNQNRERKPRHRQFDGRRIPVEDFFQYLLGWIDQAHPEIPSKHSAPIIEILLRQRLIEPKPRTKLMHLLGRCIVAERIANRIAGNQMNQKKDERDDRPHYRQNEDQSLPKGQDARDYGLHREGS
jgi:hypothetical protein